MPRALGEVGGEAGEQGRDGPHRSAMMVEPEKGMGHTDISLKEKALVPVPHRELHTCIEDSKTPQAGSTPTHALCPPIGLKVASCLYHPQFPNQLPPPPRYLWPSENGVPRVHAPTSVSCQSPALSTTVPWKHPPSLHKHPGPYILVLQPCLLSPPPSIFLPQSFLEVHSTCMRLGTEPLPSKS